MSLRPHPVSPALANTYCVTGASFPLSNAYTSPRNEIGISDADKYFDVVRSRIECTYALSLRLVDSGHDDSVSCEAQRYLVEGGTEHHKLLDLCHKRKWQNRAGTTHN